jgi:hypothetical protein
VEKHLGSIIWCEADLKEEVSRTGKRGCNKISVTNSVGKDVVHWIKSERRSSQESRRGMLALRYRGRRKTKMDEEYSTGPRTVTHDTAELYDDGNANSIYGAKPQNKPFEDNQKRGERNFSLGEPHCSGLGSGWINMVGADGKEGYWMTWACEKIRRVGFLDMYRVPK